MRRYTPFAFPHFLAFKWDLTPSNTRNKDKEQYTPLFLQLLCELEFLVCVGWRISITVYTVILTPNPHVQVSQISRHHRTFET
jgi:hypothetical protein